MESEVKEKLEVVKKTITLPLDIPMGLHKKMKTWGRANNSLKNKDFTIKETYIEFLKEKFKRTPKTTTV